MKKILIVPVLVALVLFVPTANVYAVEADVNTRVGIRAEIMSLFADFREKIARLLDADFKAEVKVKASEDDDKDMPRGVSRAPGIIKRLEDGKGLPKGILKKISGEVDTSVDTTDPKIFGVSVIKTSGTARVSWSTDEATKSEVRYSTSADVSASYVSVTNDVLVRNHEMNLTGLAADTKYFYVIVAKDANNNTETSDVFTFRTETLPVTDTIAPVITFSVASSVSANTARIVWVTNEAADSKVWLGTSSTVDTSATSAASSQNLSFYHELNVSGLSPNTRYFYTTQSADATGNAGVSTGNFFTTLPL